MITHLTHVNRLPTIAVALVIIKWTYRTIDWQLMEVRATKTNQLGICIGKESAL